MFIDIIVVAGLLFALFFFGCAIVTALVTRQMVRRAWHTSGWIFQITYPYFNGPRNYKGSIGRFAFLHISFLDPAGRQIVFKSARVPLKAGYQVGHIVSIIFEPTGKNKPRLNSVRGIWGNSFQFVGYGLVSLLAVLIFIGRLFAPYIK